MKMISAERLKEVISYNPMTGSFTWLTSTSNRAACGDQAGCIANSGYLMVGIDGEIHYGHRLAWLFVHGLMPDVIDHINGNPSDNRISNLRNVSQLENAKNSRISKRNSSGVKGVSFDKAKKKWRPYLWENGHYRLSSRFDRFEDAVAAREAASQKYQGDFARRA